MVSAEVHNTGKRASDDPLNLDQFICCSAGPLTSRNMPREADADDDADDDDAAYDESLWGDYSHAVTEALTYLKHECSFDA